MNYLLSLRLCRGAPSFQNGFTESKSNHFGRDINSSSDISVQAMPGGHMQIYLRIHVKMFSSNLIKWSDFQNSKSCGKKRILLCSFLQSNSEFLCYNPPSIWLVYEKFEDCSRKTWPIVLDMIWKMWHPESYETLYRNKNYGKDFIILVSGLGKDTRNWNCKREVTLQDLLNAGHSYQFTASQLKTVLFWCHKKDLNARDTSDSL